MAEKKAERLKVADAVQRDIDAIAKRDKDLAESGLAASALALAREIDAVGNSATSKSMCAKALREALDRLYELAPDEQETDGVDELSRRRKARRKGKAGAAS